MFWKVGMKPKVLTITWEVAVGKSNKYQGVTPWRLI